MASTKLVLNYANFVYLYDVLSSLNFFKHKDTPAERKKIFQDKLRINSNPRFVEYLRRKMFGETWKRIVGQSFICDASQLYDLLNKAWIDITDNDKFKKRLKFTRRLVASRFYSLS